MGTAHGPAPQLAAGAGCLCRGSRQLSGGNTGGLSLSGRGPVRAARDSFGPVDQRLMIMTTTTMRDRKLVDKYTQPDGQVPMTGTQALVRLPPRQRGLGG